MQHNIDLI